ncbi:hypothetical protein EYF80_028501 [Liparis tanakae]|uniref:Uncharacterized protein n=1 Tax=Liparis tanakae TaxID=230148 RepID=A0A4Z2H5Z4_9TELE|nr:hypothetical protein EYF80_028501 [Liparis tanakae]
MGARRKEGVGLRERERERRPLSDVRGLLPQAPLICPQARAQGPHWPDLITMAHWSSQKAELPPCPIPDPAASHPPVPCRVSHICTYWVFSYSSHTALCSSSPARSRRPQRRALQTFDPHDIASRPTAKAALLFRPRRRSEAQTVQRMEGDHLEGSTRANFLWRRTTALQMQPSCKARCNISSPVNSRCSGKPPPTPKNTQRELSTEENSARAPAAPGGPPRPSAAAVRIGGTAEEDIGARRSKAWRTTSPMRKPAINPRELIEAHGVTWRGGGGGTPHRRSRCARGPLAGSGPLGTLLEFAFLLFSRYPSGLWTHTPAAQDPCRQHATRRRGTPCVEATPVTALGSVLLEASWNKEKQPGSKLLD